MTEAYEQLVWNARDLHERWEAAAAVAAELLEQRRLAFYAVVEGREGRTLAQVASDVGAGAGAVGSAHRQVQGRREGERRAARAAELGIPVHRLVED